MSGTPENPETATELNPGLRPGAGGGLARVRDGKRVLVIDDDPISRSIVRDLLACRGFEVDGAESAPSALENVRRHHYDLLILDIFLPGLDGRILHGSIEKIARELAGRTIFISHWDPMGAIGEYVERHGLFLKKPFSGEQLLHAIDAVLGAVSGFGSGSGPGVAL